MRGVFSAKFTPVKRYLATSANFLYWKKDDGDKERPTFNTTRILIVKENRHNVVRGQEVFRSCSSFPCLSRKIGVLSALSTPQRVHILNSVILFFLFSVPLERDGLF